MGVEDKSWAKALVSLVTHCGIDDFAEINFLSDLANDITSESKLSDCCNAFSVVVGNNIKPCAELARNVDGAWKEVEKRKEFYDFFSKCCSYCNKACTNAMSKSGLEKKVSVFTKFNTDCVANFCAVYDNNKQNIKLIAALQIDDILYSVKEMSRDDAIAKIEGDKLAWPEELEENEKQEILNWYLEKIRIEIRRNFKLVKSKIKCKKCKNSYEEGSKCGNCEEAQNKLNEAQNYQNNEQWIEALKAANEVLKIWKDDEVAKSIVEKCTNNISVQIENIKKSISEKIQKGDYAAAQNELKENKEILGDSCYEKLTSSLSESKAAKIQKLKNDFDEALKQCAWDNAETISKSLTNLGVNENQYSVNEVNKRKLLKEFEDYLLNGDWNRAEKFVDDLVRLGCPETELRKQINDAKNGYKETLLSAFETEYKSFKTALDQKIIEDADYKFKELKKIADNLKKKFNENKDKIINDAEKSLKSLREELIVNNLPKVEKLKVETSKEKFTIEWKKPANYKYGWRINRKESNSGYKKIADYVTDNTFEDKNIQHGVQYRYKIIPVYQNSEKKELLPNENNAVESDAVFYIENIKNVVGSGEGIDDCASVELQWDMPRISNAQIEITREPEFPSPVVLNGGLSRYSDSNVQIGRKYVYTLTLTCFNNSCSPVKSNEILVQKAKPLSAFENLIQKRIADGKYSIEWDWFGNESGAKIIKSNQVYCVEKKVNDKIGSFTLVLIRGENACIEVMPYRKIGKKEITGEKVKLNFGIKPKIVCTLNKPSLFKPYILELFVEKNQLPDLTKIQVCIGKSEPISIFDGICLGSPKQDLHDMNKARLEIPSKNKGFIKVFLDSSISNEWKLVQPERNRIG